MMMHCDPTDVFRCSYCSAPYLSGSIQLLFVDVTTLTAEPGAALTFLPFGDSRAHNPRTTSERKALTVITVVCKDSCFVFFIVL